MRATPLFTLVPLALLAAPLAGQAGSGASLSGRGAPPSTAGGNPAGAFSSRSITPRILDAPAYYPASEDGQFRAVGDLNLDGAPDLVLFEGFGDNDWTGFRPYLGDGLGLFNATASVAFSQPLGLDEFVARREPLLGDFNGDGHPDLMVERYVSSSTSPSGVHIFLGDGLGSFPVELFAVLPGTPVALVLGQMDGDPAREIAVMYEGFGPTPGLRWIDWYAAGPFSAVSIVLGGPTDPDGGLRDPLGADVDGDGDTDLWGLNQDRDRLRSITTHNGGLSFGPSFPLFGVFVSPQVYLHAGDLDADGDSDLVLVRTGLGTGEDVALAVFRNDGGTLAEQPPMLVDLPTPPVFDGRCLEVADWDGDGLPELLSPGTNGHLLILANTGSLQFEYAGSRFVGGGASEAGTADIDRDGHPDFVSTNSVLYGDGIAAGAMAPISEDSHPLLAGGQPLPVDFDGDGDLDLIGTPAGNVWINDATGALSEPKVPPLPGPFSTPVAFGDFTGDGRGDQLYARYTKPQQTTSSLVGMFLLVDDGLGSYIEVLMPAAPPGEEILPPAVGIWPVSDADGDGDADLLVENGYWRNQGTGYLEAFVWTGFGFPLDAADVDGDGQPEVLARHLAAQHELVLWKDVGSSFAPQVLAAGSDLWLGRLVDLDGDSDLDLAGGARDQVGLWIFENSAGNLNHVATLDAGACVGAQLAVHDADGDGLGDLFCRRDSMTPPPGAEVLAFFARKPGPLAYQPGGYSLVQGLIGWGDFDGDGDLDAMGPQLIDGLEHDGPQSGLIRQYGSGVVGSGGLEPILGAAGPLWATGLGAELRLRRGIGGLPTLVGVGFAETAVAGLPSPGYTLLIDNPNFLPQVSLTGPILVPGVGELDLLLPTDGSLAGIRLFFQAFVLDPGVTPGLWSQTGGLELLFGS